MQRSDPGMRLTAFLLMLIAVTGLSAQQGPTSGYAPVDIPTE